MTKKPDKTLLLRSFKWTPKRRLFVNLMPANGFNATKSAEKAGYSKKTARQTGYELMQIPQIRKDVEKEQEKIAWKAVVSVERILRELEVPAYSKINDYVTIKKDGSIKLKSFARMKNQSRAIQSIKEDTWITKGKGGDALVHRSLSFKLIDKLRALDMLGKYKQMFIQRIDLTGELTLKPKFDLKELRTSFDLINGRKSGPTEDSGESVPDL